MGAEQAKQYQSAPPAREPCESELVTRQTTPALVLNHQDSQLKIAVNNISREKVLTEVPSNSLSTRETKKKLKAVKQVVGGSTLEDWVDEVIQIDNYKSNRENQAPTNELIQNHDKRIEFQREKKYRISRML